MQTRETTEVQGATNRDTYVDAAGLAELLHLNAATVRRAARRGRLPHIRIGRSYRFSLAKIEQALERR